MADADKDKLNSSIDELGIELVDSQDALQNLVFQKSMQQLEDLCMAADVAEKSCPALERLDTFGPVERAYPEVQLLRSPCLASLRLLLVIVPEVASGGWHPAGLVGVLRQV